MITKGQVERLAPFLVVLRLKSSSTLTWEGRIIVRHHYAGKVYLIEFPPGSRVKRSEAAGESVVYVPHEGGEIPIFEEPGELLIQLARKGKYGLRLIGVEERLEA